MDRGWRPFAQCSAVARRLRLHALIICRCYPFPSVTARAGARRPGVRSRRRKCRSIMGKRSAPDEGHDSGARRSAGEPGRFLQLFCLPYSGPAPRCSAAGSPACRAGSACYPWNCRGAAFASARPCIPMPPAWSRNWPASCKAPSIALLLRLLRPQPGRAAGLRTGPCHASARPRRAAGAIPLRRIPARRKRCQRLPARQGRRRTGRRVARLPGYSGGRPQRSVADADAVASGASGLSRHRQLPLPGAWAAGRGAAPVRRTRGQPAQRRVARLAA